MNTRSRITATLAGIVTTCLLSAGAAVAQPPVAPNGAPVPSPVAQAPSNDPGKTRAGQLALQKANAERLQRALAEKSPAAPTGSPDEARRATVEQGGARGSSVDESEPVTTPGTATHQAPSAPASDSGNGSEILWLAITGLAGLVLGAAGGAVARGMRKPARPAAVVEAVGDTRLAA